MKPMALLGAIAAAAVGAGAWAAIAYFANYELGLLAWGIGGMVGGAAFALGGRGPISGGVAAGLVLVAILGGKGLAYSVEIKNDVDTILAETEEEFLDELMSDAEAYPGSDDRGALREFIVEHGFYEGASEEEVEWFLSIWAPSLERWKVEQPDFETFLIQYEEILYSQDSLVEIIQANLGLFDLLFAFFGVTTAFKLAGRPEDLFTGGEIEITDDDLSSGSLDEDLPPQ
jgi:hypothetical protein